MNCEFMIEKSDLPDTKVILISLIEEKYCLKLNYQSDKIFLVDKNNTKIPVITNNLEDLKDNLPKQFKILIIKEMNKDSSINKHQIDLMLKDLESNNFGFNKDPDAGESLYIKTEKASDIKKPNEIYAFETDAFNKIYTYLTSNAYSATQEFDIAMNKKPYTNFYYQSLNAIKQSKEQIVDLVDKLKKFQSYVSNLEKQNKDLESKIVKSSTANPNTGSDKILQEKYNSLLTTYEDLKKSCFEITKQNDILKAENIRLEKQSIRDLTSSQFDQKESGGLLKEVNKNLENKVKELEKKFSLLSDQESGLLFKYKDLFLADIYNDNYISRAKTVSKEVEHIAQFYNDLVMQVKNNLMPDLRAVQDFLDFNISLIKMICNSKAYLRGRHITKVELSKLESKLLKDKCDAFGSILNNIYNILSD